MSQAISVVVPAFNYGCYLAEAIRSVLAQSFSDFELIIVDDGSKDDTRKIVHRFPDPRIRYIYQSNRGLSAARNTGIANARFALIAFLDADDLWMPEMLASAHARFQLLPPSFGLAACDSLRISQEGALLDHSRRGGRTLSEREIRSRDLILKSHFMPSTVVARREVFERVGAFDTSLRSTEDRDMWIRAASQFRVHYVSEPLVRIRKHGSNMSKNADRMRQNMRRVLAKSFQGGIRSPGMLSAFFRAYAFHFFEVAWMYFDEDRTGEAIAALLKSLVLWPVFLAPGRDLDQPLLFRIRALVRFVAKFAHLGGE
jgi:glycosyltransferase involved in cell wall biosynthesis